MADIKLKQWADVTLPRKCVEVAWETLRDEFCTLLNKAKSNRDHDDIFDNLKAAVVDEAMKRHEWEEKVGIKKAALIRVVESESVESHVFSWSRSRFFLNCWCRSLVFKNAGVEVGFLKLLESGVGFSKLLKSGVAFSKMLESESVF